MGGEALRELRNKLQSFVDAAGGARETGDLVAAFRKAHGAEIAAASADLEHRALVKLVDDVSRRRRTSARSGQGDLFFGFSMRSAIMVEVAAGKRTKWMRQNSLTATFAQVEAYLKRQPEARKVRKDKGMEATLEMVRPFITSPDMLMSDALAAARAAAGDTETAAG